MKKLLSIILVISVLSACSTSKGYDYKSHSKHNSQLKKKSENGTLKKCNRK